MMLSPLLPLLPTIAALTTASTITEFHYSGSGCRQSTTNAVTYTPSSSSSSAWLTPQTYTFSEFATRTTANCELHFAGGGLPAGLQVSVAEVEFTGKLAAAAEEIQWFWQGYWSDDAADTRTLTGTIDAAAGGFTVKTNVTEALWSECIGSDGDTGILNANLRVVVVSGGGGMVEVDTETLRYKFRRCQ